MECWLFDPQQRLQSRQHHSSAVSPTQIDSTACDTTTASFSYPDQGIAPTQRIEQVAHASDTETVSSVQYVDGLGRVYKEARQAENGEYVISMSGWGSRGEAICQTLPFETTDPASPALCETILPYREREHDPLLRPIRTVLHTPSGAAWGPGAFEESLTTFQVEDHDGLPSGSEQSPEFVTTHTVRGTYPGGSATPDWTRRSGHDARGRVVSVEAIHPTLSNLTLVQRDVLGRITRVDGPPVARDGGGTHDNLLVAAYDLLGRRISLTEAADAASPTVGPTWIYDWDRNGNLVSEVPVVCQNSVEVKSELFQGLADAESGHVGAF